MVVIYLYNFISEYLKLCIWHSIHRKKKLKYFLEVGHIFICFLPHFFQCVPPSGPLFVDPVLLLLIENITTTQGQVMPTKETCVGCTSVP